MRPIATMAALAALISGCGQDGPALVPVSGTLKREGQPLEGASVTFAPEPTNPVVTPGGALSGPDGGFTARYADRPGLAPGKYKVLVSKTATKDGKPIPDSLKDDPAMLAVSGLTIETLPADYGNANTTPLAAEVGDDGGTFDFEVKASTKAGKKR